VLGPASEKCAKREGGARHVWTLGILVGTLLACGAFGKDARPVSLDPPLNHWLYQLPEADQMALVSVTVWVQDELGAPVPKATVLAHCLPWHYVCRETADENGQASLQGPLGDWTVYAGRSGYLAVKRNVTVARDCKIIVASENRTASRFMDILPPETGQELSYGHCAIALDLEDIPTPSTSRLNIGSLQNSTLELSSTPGIKGWLWITRDASADQSGLALGYPYNTAEPEDMPDLDSGLSELRMHFDGLGEKVRAVVNFTNLDQVCHTGYVAYYIPPAGGEATIRVTPGTYRLDATVMPGAGIVYLSQTRRLEPNDVCEFDFGSTFTVQARVLTWNRSQLHLWFDIIDNYGNCLLQVPSDDTYVRLTQDGSLIYEGPTYESRSRHLRLDLDWEPYWREESPISYEYQISNAATGNLRVTGSFPSDPNISLAAGNLPIAYQSDHFELRLLDLPEERGRRLAEGLETALQWLFTRYAGPVSPANRERWPLESKAPVGVGWSGGSQFSVNVYGGSILEPQLPEGNTSVLFHELGHCYQASPPHHQARAMGSTTCESNASLLAGYAMKAVQGDRGLQYMQQTYADRFFQRLLSGAPNSKPNADDYDFIYFYIHNRYGQAVHRDFQRTMYRSEGNCEAILLSADFLVSEGERSAAIYSFLCGDNLAWLYRWIGEDVTDEVIDQAIAYFTLQGATIPESPAFR